MKEELQAIQEQLQHAVVDLQAAYEAITPDGRRYIPRRYILQARARVKDSISALTLMHKELP